MISLHAWEMRLKFCRCLKGMTDLSRKCTGRCVWLSKVALGRFCLNTPCSRVKHLTRFIKQGPLTGSLLDCRSQDVKILEGRLQQVGVPQDQRHVLSVAPQGHPSGAKALKVSRICIPRTFKRAKSRRTCCMSPCTFAGLFMRSVLVQVPKLCAMLVE